MIGATLMACVPGRQPTADEIVGRMEQAEAQVRDYHGIVETALAEPGSGDRVFVQEIWRRGSDLVRVEIREGPAQMVGRVTVFNGERVWSYDPQLNQVRILPVLAPFQLPQWEMEAAVWATAKELLRESTANYLAEDRVAGRRAHKVQLVPRSGTDLFGAVQGGPITVWIDEEHARRLKMEVPLPAGRRYTMEYQLLEVNVGLPDSLFEFTSPPGAEVVTQGVVVTAPTVREMELIEAQREARFPLLLPAHLPLGMSFSQARVMEGGESVTLIYAGDKRNLTVTEAVANPGVRLPDIGQEISLRGTTARLQLQGDRLLSLRWQEEGVVIFVSGTVSEEEALEVARSMK